MHFSFGKQGRYKKIASCIGRNSSLLTQFKQEAIYARTGFDNNLNHLKAYFKQIYKAQHQVEAVFSEWLRKLCNSWLKEEFYFQAGAEYYQRSPNRLDYGNGYYRRHLLTASGRIELNVPRGKRRRYKYTLFDKYKLTARSLKI